MAGYAAPSSEFPLRPHPHLYELNTWAWLEQLSMELGRPIELADVPDAHWDSIARRGFDIVWLMGVWVRSPESRRIALADRANFALYDRALPGWQPSDVICSPYAVVEYAPDPRIGTWDGLDRVRHKLRTRGMALFLDFVGNHTALDHPWTREHPEFYVQGSQQDFQAEPSNFYPVETEKGTVFLALGRDPYFPPWKDVAQLNHFEPRLRTAQFADLRRIAGHCDGVRCDMAMLQLSDIFRNIWGHLLCGAEPPAKEFWKEAHEALPGLMLLAEAYWGTEPRLLEMGFSFAYDKELYDAVRDIKTSVVHARLAAEPASQSRLARFLENHDELPSAAVFGRHRLPAPGVLMGTLPGMRFYYQRELEGGTSRLPITLRIAAEERPDPFTAAFFETILRITNEEVFHQGRWSLLPVAPESDATSENLVAYEWRSDQSWNVIAVNLAAKTSQGRVHLGSRVSPAEDYVFYDKLDGIHYRRDGKELHDLGLFVRLGEFQAHLFDVTPA
jgi:glycosidase